MPTDYGIQYSEKFYLKFKGLSNFSWDLSNSPIYYLLVYASQNTCLLLEIEVNVNKTVYRILSNQGKLHRFSIFITQKA